MRVGGYSSGRLQTTVASALPLWYNLAICVMCEVSCVPAWCDVVRALGDGLVRHIRTERRGATVKAVEVTGTVDADGRLHLDASLPVRGPCRVRAVVLVPEDSDEAGERDPWRTASSYPPTGLLREETGDTAYSSDDLRVLKREVSRQLDRLPLDRQRHILGYVRMLLREPPHGAPGRQLLPFAGVLGEEDARAIAEAIEKGCERVDENEW